MKRILSIILALAMMTVTTITALAAEPMAGSGTEAEPYIIMDEADLESLITKVANAGGTTVYAKLGAEITKTGETWFDGALNLDLANQTLNASLYFHKGSRVSLYNGTVNGGFYMYHSGNAAVKNVQFQHTGSYTVVAATYDTTGSVLMEMDFENCQFAFDQYYVYAARPDTVISFTDCTFTHTNNGNFKLFGKAESYHGTVYFQGVKLTEDIDATGSHTVGDGYNDNWNADNRDVNVAYDVTPIYTVTIPETVELGETATVSAQDVVVNKGSHVEVSLADSDFKVKTGKGAELAYTVTMDGKQINVGDVVLAVEPGDTNSGSANLSFDLANGEVIKYAGEYKGLVTFNISVETGYYTKIRTSEQLAAFRDRVNNGETNLDIKLMNDIDLGGSQENQWTPIGNSYTPFNGVFDGNGHTISALYINRSESNFQGLFGHIKDGTVKNLTVDGSVTGYQNIGGIAGFNEGIVENCNFAGDVSGNGYVGGIAGRNIHGTVKGCYNTGTVGGNYYIGGAAGDNSYGTIVNSYNTGSINGKDCVGGVAGINPLATITNCYSTGIVSGNSNVGGAVGLNNSTVTSVYYLDACGAGGVGASLTADQFKQQSNFSDWDFDTVWQMNDTLGRPTLQSNPE